MNPIWQSVIGYLLERRRHCPNCDRPVPKSSGEKAEPATCPWCGARLGSDSKEK
jgi:uncharacterized paraquat-inducible protein A